MNVLRARVRSGRLIVDEPTELPEGTELNLVGANGGDDLDDRERAALHESIADGVADATAGRVQGADEVLKHLRSRR